MKISVKRAGILFAAIISVIMFFRADPLYAKSAASVPKLQMNKLLVNSDDTESIVFLIVGDGFQKDEQELFNEKASEVKDYILNTDPFSEFKDKMNFYSLNVISNKSGAADNPESLKDTYFQCTYNYYYNIERLLAPMNSYAAVSLANYYVPDYDCILMIVNDERYGGSGGKIPVTSTNEYSYEIMMHEMGHSIGGLADEYWAGTYYAWEAPNMTQKDDPDIVPWSDLIGTNGIGIYPYAEDPTWYHPSESCKMEYLGTEYPYCDVCSRVLVDRLEDLRWQTNSIWTYGELLEDIKITPSKKTLYLGGSSGKSVLLNTKLPAVLHKVSKFTEKYVNIDNMEVTFTYKSSNPKIASVSANGMITAKGKGRTTIIVTTQLANSTKYEFQINITVNELKAKH